MRRQLDRAGAWCQSHGAPGAKRGPAAAAGRRRAATRPAGSPARSGTARRATPVSPSHATCAQHMAIFFEQCSFHQQAKKWRKTVISTVISLGLLSLKQCSGSGSQPGSGSTGSTCFWVSRIRIRLLLSSNKNSKKNLDFYSFVTFLGLFVFEEWFNCTLQKGLSIKT